MSEFTDNGMRVRPIKGSKDCFIREDGVKLRKRVSGGFIYCSGSIHKRNGYVNHSVNGKQHRAHRLVATAFIPNPSNLPLVDHIDNNSVNNHVSNLRWVTNQENVQYYFADQQPSIQKVTSMEKELLAKVNSLSVELANALQSLELLKEEVVMYKEGVKDILLGNPLDPVIVAKINIGTPVTINGKVFSGSASAAQYIVRMEAIIGHVRNHDTVNKELKRVVRGLRPVGVMYGLYSVWANPKK